MAPPDMDKFRLRLFVEKLCELGEVETHEEQINLSEIAAVIEDSPHVVWFKQVGPDKLELVANVNGSRKRLAAAMDISEDNIADSYIWNFTNTPYDLYNIYAVIDDGDGATAVSYAPGQVMVGPLTVQVATDIIGVPGTFWI